VYLVNDEHFVLALLRLEAHLVHEGADVFDAVVGGGVEFHDVEGSVFAEGFATVAFAARLCIVGNMATVEDFGQDSGAGGFPNAPRPAKQEGMGQMFCLQSLLQGLRHVLLSDYIFETEGAVFSGGNYVTHELLLAVGFWLLAESKGRKFKWGQRRWFCSE